MMEYIDALEKNPAQISCDTNDVWKEIVSKGKLIVQIAAKVEEVKSFHEDLAAPWKKYFTNCTKPASFRYQI
jgi:hypothetical protein